MELYRPGIFIFIYNSETPPRLRGVDVETLGCNGMRLLRWVGVGREGGRGVSSDSFGGAVLPSRRIQLQTHTKT